MALRFGVALLNSTAEMRSEIESLWARRPEMRKLPPGALLEAHYHNFGSFDLSAEPLLGRIAKARCCVQVPWCLGCFRAFYGCFRAMSLASRMFQSVLRAP